MLTYIVRRFLIGFLTLLLISFVIYALIRNMPGTPLTLATAESDPSKKISKEDMERLKRTYGLDKPWPVAYAQWLGNVARLDLGRSISRKQPVTKLISEKVGPTLLLSVTSLLLAYGLSIPAGLYATARTGTLDERIVSTALYMLYSLPSYVAALLLLVLFYVKLDGTVFHLTPGMVGNDYDRLSTVGKCFDLLRHMILPVACYTYGTLAFDTRFVKANMLEVVRQDYIRTARAKGVSPFDVLVRHAFRNTLIPFVTLLGLSLPGLLGGAVLLEQIFNWPGMGQLYFEAITERDYPTIMGLTMMFAVLTLIGNLLADVLYAFVDPRITYT